MFIVIFRLILYSIQRLAIGRIIVQMAVVGHAVGEIPDRELHAGDDIGFVKIRRTFHARGDQLCLHGVYAYKRIGAADDRADLAGLIGIEIIAVFQIDAFIVCLERRGLQLVAAVGKRIIVRTVNIGSVGSKTRGFSRAVRHDQDAGHIYINRCVLT